MNQCEHLAQQANTFRNQGKANEAITLLQAAVVLEKVELSNLLARTTEHHLSLSAQLIAQQRYSEADDLLETSRAYLDSYFLTAMEESRLRLEYISNYGESLLGQRRYEEAFNLLASFLKHNNNLANSATLGQIYAHLSDAQSMNDLTEEALLSCDKALEILDRLPHHGNLVETLKENRGYLIQGLKLGQKHQSLSRRG